MQHIWLIYLAAEHLLSSLYTGSFPSHLLRIFKKINNYKRLFFHRYCRKWLLFTCKHEGKVEPKHTMQPAPAPWQSHKTPTGTKAGMWGWEQQPAKGKITAALSDSTSYARLNSSVEQISYSQAAAAQALSFTVTQEVFSFVFGFQNRHE